MMNEEAFDIYLITTGVLALNLLFLAFATGAARSKAKKFVNSEDAERFGGEKADAEDPAVARVGAAHRNALENIPLFLFLGLLYLMADGGKTGAMAYFITFAVARWLHSICYLKGLQPWRTASFALGTLVNVGLIVQLFIAAFT